MKTISVNDWNISDVAIEQETPTFFSESINYKGSSIGTGLHRFSVKFSITTDTDSDVRRLNALLLSLKGQQETFLLDLGTDNHWFNPMTVDVPNVVNTAKILVGSVSMNLSNTQIPEGTFFQFPNNSKVFVITERSGNQYNFYPACRTEVPATSQINVRNPKLKLRMTKNSFTMKMGRAETIGFECKEDI